MTEELWEKLDAFMARTEARLAALEGKPATEITGAAGNITITAEALGLPVVARGWVTPLSAAEGANIRKSTHLSAEIAYVLAYGDSREATSSIAVEAPDGRKFVWHILADNNVVRGDVVRFSQEKPVFVALPQDLYPCPTKYDVFTSNGYHPPVHSGWDLATFGNRIGEPVYAGPYGGVAVQVKKEGYNDGFGTHVIMRYTSKQIPALLRDSLPPESFVYVMYAHLSEVSVNLGDVVAGNRVIGKMGSTGNSSGAHLHVECRHSTSPFSAFWQAVLFDPARMYYRLSR